MDIYRGPFRLPPESTGLVEPSDWIRYDEPRNFVHHRHRHLIFQIDVITDKAEDERLSPNDFAATLCHLCDGNRLPKDDELASLAEQAITFYLVAIGMLRLLDDE